VPFSVHDGRRGYRLTPGRRRCGLLLGTIREDRPQLLEHLTVLEVLAGLRQPGDHELADQIIAELLFEALGGRIGDGLRPDAALDQLNELASPDEIRETANLTELGADLDQADGDAFYAGVNQCIDVRAFFLDLVTGGNAQARACMDQAISDAALQEAFVGGLLLGSESLDPEVESSITDAYDQCAAELAPDG